MPSVFTLKALGLNTQPNQLEVPPGSLSLAGNVNIARTDVVEPRRGFALYGNSFGSASDIAKQLFSYKLRILRHFANTLQFDDGKGNFNSFDATVTEAVTGQRIKSIESNGNLYLTTSAGIQKISAFSPEDFTTQPNVVVPAGAIQAVDVTGKVNYKYGDQTDFLPQDSAVSYRVVWGYKDKNNNLLLGAPSQLIQVYNPLLNFLLPDYMQVLGAIDDIGRLGSFIDNQDYVRVLGLPIDATGSQLYTNLTTLVNKLDHNLFFADNYRSQGSWDASTNTPKLADNISTVNDTYIVGTGGTQNLGNGSVTYTTNEVLVYNGFNWNVASSYNFLGNFDASLQFLGEWNAANNLPTLADGTGTLNTYYRVNVPGTQNLGSGSQTFSTGDYVQYNGSQWLRTTSPRFFLQNGVGNEGDLYLVTTAGNVNFNIGGVLTPITLNINDFLTYHNNQYVKLTGSIEINNPDATLGTSFKYLGSWNASTNSPFLYDTTAKNGDFYTVSTGGTQDLGNGSITFTAGDTVMFNNNFWTITNYHNQGSWNAETNTPTLINGTGTQGDYYIVDVAGTQNLGSGPVAYNVNDRLMYVNGQWVVNTFNIKTTAPLIISTVNIASGVCTITFSSGNPKNYFTSGSLIDLEGFSTTLNGKQTVASVTTTTITFNTSAVGDASGNVYPDETAAIYSYDFRNISVPAAPATFPTDQDLVNMQTYLKNIIQQLLLQPTQIISTTLSTKYIATLEITTAGNVTLTITIPEGITSNYFFQIYRSATFSATGTQVLATDVVPNDELAQVYEAFPTAAQLSAGTITVTDIVPDSFRGANLYTNASTGEGILQANTPPPFATDVNTFQGSVFYSNTHIQHYMSLTLLGVQNMITDYNNNITPTLTIATENSSNTYTFVTGKPEIFTITCNAGSTLATVGTASYFDATNGSNSQTYRFWYNTGAVTAPSVTTQQLVPIVVSSSDSSSVIAQKTNDAFNLLNFDFSSSYSSNVVTVACVSDGATTAPSAGTSGFAFSVTQAGQGENASAKQVLLSTNISPAIAVTETANSLARVVNLNPNENVYIYYTSGFQQVPGQMLVQGRNLGIPQFFLVTNNNHTGSSFSPSLAPTLQISSITTGNSLSNLVTTSTPHGLANLDFIFISGSNSTPSIDGYKQITYVSPTTFRVNATITGTGNKGGIISFVDAESSQDDNFPNRIFYSKLQQPEAVPTTNFFDVGAKDKAILRIFPLRDSLFIFKQDGIYRISGSSIPFNLALFDSSCILIAPDSVSAVDNVIYGWTRQGISSITEVGTRNISRPLDVTLLPLSSSSHTNFIPATWGLGYESEKTYTVYTVTNSTDTTATQGFKYNTMTNAWTAIDASKNCGVINFSDDKMYLGPTDVNFIEQERKNYDRTDYADREFDLNVLVNSNNTSIFLDSIKDININDVLVQQQPVSIFQFNSLLQTLDTDAGLSVHNFYSTLALQPFGNLRSSLLSLAAKLDISSLSHTNYTATIGDLSGSISSIIPGEPAIITSANHGLINGRQILIAGTNSSPTINGQFTVTVIDNNTFSVDPNFVVITEGTAGTWETVGTNFADIQVCYNALISLLNSDNTLRIKTYMPVLGNTQEEVVITGINKLTNQVTVAQSLPFIQGAIISYQGIDSVIIYSPYSFGGDPASLKHIREAQILFDNLAFTGGTISFASDLMPEFQDVPFLADGTGIMGSQPFGQGFFGGTSDGAPIRTYIPRQAQRCRYLVIKFEHNVARDKWALNGITLTGETQLSSRAFK